MKASKSPHESQPKHYINSLFMKWLSEWKDDAAQKELKTQYSYAKVVKLQSINRVTKTGSYKPRTGTPAAPFVPAAQRPRKVRSASTY